MYRWGSARWLLRTWALRGGHPQGGLRAPHPLQVDSTYESILIEKKVMSESDLCFHSHLDPKTHPDLALSSSQQSSEIGSQKHFQHLQTWCLQFWADLLSL